VFRNHFSAANKCMTPIVYKRPLSAPPQVRAPLSRTPQMRLIYLVCVLWINPEGPAVKCGKPLNAHVECIFHSYPNYATPCSHKTPESPCSPSTADTLVTRRGVTLSAPKAFVVSLPPAKLTLHRDVLPVLILYSQDTVNLVNLVPKTHRLLCQTPSLTTCSP